MISRWSSVLAVMLLAACSAEDGGEERLDSGADATVDGTVGDAGADATANEDASADADDDASADADEDASADADDDASADATAGEDAKGDATVDDDAAAADADVADAAPAIPETYPAPCVADVGGGDDAEGGGDDAAGDDAGGDDAGGDDAGGGGGDTTACTTRVRIVASNLTSGSSSSYDLPGIRILQGLHPDIALMQEFKYPGGYRALVDTAFGASFEYVTETSIGTIPNAIVSRYPILESGEWDDPSVADRDFVWARIDVPGPTDLYAVSVHLLTSSSTARDTEAKNLVAYVKAKVPAGAYLVIGGDLNTAAVTEPALTELAELLVTGAPYAADQAGNENTNAPRSKPYDWVLPNAYLNARMIPVVIGAKSYPAGLVFDTRVYTPLSDASPALPTDSAATNMQHMAIVRDFALGG